MPSKLKNTRLLVISAVAVVALFGIAYFILFDTDSPSEFSLETKGSTNNTAAAPPAGCRSPATRSWSST